MTKKGSSGGVHDAQELAAGYSSGHRAYEIGGMIVASGLAIWLAAKGARLDGVLTFSVPNHWRFVTEEEQDSGLRPSGRRITVVVFINKAMCQHWDTPWSWHVAWYCFCGVSIEIMPIVFLEHFSLIIGCWKLKASFLFGFNLRHPNIQHSC
jgi:hypothetical protein